MRYPINVCKECYENEYAEFQNYLDDLGSSCNWDELIAELSDDQSLINVTRLPARGEPLQKLYTPLHQAANGNATKEIFETLLHLGASKCLKSNENETAFDIAKRNGLDNGILDMLQIPQNVMDKENEITKMEEALHTVILGRVGDLIEHNCQVLPQLSFLYEKGDFYFPVPCMYGGFNVTTHENGIEVYSEIRIMGGSDMRHQIDKEGNVTLLNP